MNMLKTGNAKSKLPRVFHPAVVLAMVLTVPAAASAAGQSGRLDHSFGDRGVVLLPDGGGAGDTVLQPDGKLASTAKSLGRLVRHHSDGSLDTSFGNGTGYVPAPETAVALQPDGKLVAVDSISVGYPRYAFRVQRFNPDGSIDAAFGDNGTAIAEFESTLEPMEIHGHDVRPWDVAVQDDGKILVVGAYNYYRYDGFAYDHTPVAQALARFNGDGSPDTGFGDIGKLVTDTITASDPGANPRESLYASALQPDGRILVAGYLENDDYDMMVTRYNADGSLDTTFGVNGVASIDLGGADTGWDLAVQPNGDIVVVGRRELNGFFSADIALLRLHSNGTVDSGFGTGGASITDYQGHQDGAYAVALQADGKIVIGGFVTKSGPQDSTDMLMSVLRYNVDGSLDGDFARNGIAAMAINEGMGDSASDVLIQVDGKIVASGSAILRYLP